MTLGQVIGTAAILVTGLLAYSVIYSRSKRKQLFATIAQIKASDLPQILQTGLTHFQSHKIAEIDFTKPMETIDSLDWFIREQRHRLQFPDYKGLGFNSWIIYTGAILGEILRQNEGAKWLDSPGGPSLAIERDGKTMNTYPFEKVYKHERIGEDGDLQAYLKMSQIVIGNRPS